MASYDGYTNRFQSITSIAYYYVSKITSAIFKIRLSSENLHLDIELHVYVHV